MSSETTQNTLRKERDNFTMVQNEILVDIEISLSAKGLYAFMRSKPDNWNFTIRSMAKQLKEGQTAIGNYLKELRSFGWISHKKNHDGTGVYFIYNAPLVDEKPKPENPNQENPNQGLCNMQESNRISNTDLSNKTDASNTDLYKVESSFDIFWTAGMVKVNKKKALSLFTSIVKNKKLDAHQFAQQLADDVKARLKSGQLGFNAMHPTTYLNGERWTDDIVRNTSLATRQPNADNRDQINQDAYNKLFGDDFDGVTIDV